MQNRQFEFVAKDKVAEEEFVRPTLSYSQDVFRRFMGNKLAVIGLVGVVIIVILAVLAPILSPFNYSDQRLEYGNIPPVLSVVEIFENRYVYVHQDYKLIMVNKNGKILSAPTADRDDKINRTKFYTIDGKKITLKYFKDKSNEIYVDDELVTSTPKSKWNKTYFLGTDKLGRDLWVRILYGARISLIVGVAAAAANMLIGVLYGGISGFEGGKIDYFMMRIIDIINSIPLMLIVILIMVVSQKQGISTIILAIGMVYWIGMARQVRGQILSLKEQEFVLAAKTFGATKWRIITKHLIPNALGPIIVSMMMSIPSAIFTEAFLSFIGLGVSAPEASWGTLASDALGGIRSFPYLLLAPSIAIAATMFAFNFVGDGLRDALDPKLRK